MVSLNSRRFVYVFKNRLHDSKTFECSNSSQKVRILLKKLGGIRKSLSYREKFIQGTDKFVRPNKMFEFPSIRVIESQLQIQSNLYKTDSLGAKKIICLIQVSVFSRFPYFCIFSGQLKGP